MITENDLEDFEPTKAPTVTPPSDKVNDKINNIRQKESALNKAGVTRLKAFKFVAESLEAMKLEDTVDSQCNVVRVLVPDVERREWAVEMAGKYFGDFVTKQEGGEGGIKQLIIIRASGEQTGNGIRPNEAGRGEATEAKAIPGQVRIQSKGISGDVVVMGNRKNHVLDISGDAVLRADTE